MKVHSGNWSGPITTPFTDVVTRFFCSHEYSADFHRLFNGFSRKGLEKSWDRHQKMAEYFHAGLESMGLKLFVKEKVRLPTVTTIVAPHGYDWKEITTYIMKTHSLEISGGLGTSVGLVLRVGLMGCNSSKANADMVLAALKDALKHCHRSKV
uniref:alanine--glyoxylate transaminase n=1 Tax=Xiphophorus couchianus TaxID=32473 RepID=A0A3B5LAB7_9TELE